MFHYFKQFNHRKPCPLSFLARLTYSYLSYRDRVGQGSTKTDLRRALQVKSLLDLNELVGHGLVTDTDNAFRALPPVGTTKDWFVESKTDKTKHWADQFMGHQRVLPSETCPLTARQLSVWCIARDFFRQDKLVSPDGIAVCLAIDPKTAVASLDELRRVGLCSLRRDRPGRYDFEPVTLNAFSDWFVKVERVKSSEPAWKRLVNGTRPSELVASRVWYVCERLAKVYPIPSEGGFNPYTGVWLPGLDDFLIEKVDEAVQGWDNTKYKTWVPLFLHLVRDSLRVWQYAHGNLPYMEFATFRPGTHGSTENDQTPVEAIGSDCGAT